jgi:DNA-binding transcriptional MerR regulator/methylmalonyl-CoA mutase cobalamin-binding subunit
MYTIKQAALRSGVNVSLLRAWERRYGIVSPARTDSGYRLYDDEAIDRLRAMRTLVDAGWSARQAAERVASGDLDELQELAEGSGRAAGEADTTGDFVGAAARIDAAGIERALDDMFTAGSFERVIEERLYPALHALGEAWAGGEVDVAGEHAASAGAVRRLGMAFEASGRGPFTASAPVLVGLPPGARHEVAALAFATAARRAGLAVVYLGADVPVDSWVAAVDRTGARAVALGAVIEQDVAAATDVVRALREAHPDLVIGVGGARSGSVDESDVMRLPDPLVRAVEVMADALG